MSDPILDAAARKGSAELLILATLADTELHGYDLCRRIAERSGGVLTFRVASLYPVLYRLEDRGWIEGTWRQVRRTPAADVPAHGGGSQGLDSEADAVVIVRRRVEPRRRIAPCLSGCGSFGCASPLRVRIPIAIATSSRRSRCISTTSTERGRRADLSDEAARAAVERELNGLGTLLGATLRRRRRPFTGIRATDLLGDVRRGFRALRARPSASAVIVLTLAVGIGACTTVFSLFSTVLLKSLPFPESNRLVLVWEADKAAPTRPSIVAGPVFEDWARMNQTLDAIGIWGSRK